MVLKKLFTGGTFLLIIIIINLFSLAFISNVFGKDKDENKIPTDIETALQNLVNEEYERFSALPLVEGTYIFITEKTCLPCIPKLTENENLKKGSLHFIIVIEDNPLLISSKKRMVREQFKGKAIFYFYPRTANSLFFENSPSPFFLLKTSEGTHFYDYEKTLKILDMED